MPRETSLTGHERFFDDDDLIVSKTDLKGHITYCNPLFLKLAGYSEKELLQQPHSIIRHPDMPRSIFKLLWETVENGKEIFAYVVNRTKLGDHYWVFAHVTPTFDAHGQIIGYHSNRRVPARSAVETISGLYKQLLDVERPYRNPKDACQASIAVLQNILKENGITYDEFVFSLAHASRSAA